jgi:RHS repeat-associated protein
MAILNNVDGTRSQTFSYDPLNRVLTAGTVNASGSNCWGEQYGYDEWGNLLTIGMPPGYSSCAQPDNLSLGVNAKNQISNSGYTYDPAGNLTAIPGAGGGTFTYNAENQMLTAAGVTYAYDGDGKRVKKSSGTLYWYGAGSDVLEETTLSGTATNDYIFFGELRIARRDASGNVFPYFADHLGSSRRIEEVAAGASTASPCYDADFYPFGREHAFTDSCPQNYKFTGKERDGESGLDYFGARYYSSSLGRFMSPDWSVKEEPVPYAKLPDPQTLNLYSYVENNPTTLRDPDGHCTDPLSCGVEFAGIGTLVEPGGGTAVGAIVGGLVGGAILYLSAKVIVNQIHRSDHTSNGDAPPAASPQNETQSQSTPADPNRKGEGGAKKTEHGGQRADEARAGDAHRNVGDANRVIREGQQYTDSETGNTVHVRGNRVVVTNEKGEIVSQFKNARANTQQRVDSGRWVRKLKPGSQ